MNRENDSGFTNPVYYDDDAKTSSIENEVVGILGYGSQGHAQAQNLADSGIDVVVGLPVDSASRQAAKDDGLTVKSPSEAAEVSDRIVMLVPDTVQPTLYNQIQSGIEEGDTLQFAHGFNIHYGQIEPSKDVDVTMIAPKTPGHLLRRTYTHDEGAPGLLAVYQDASGSAHEKALAYAKAIGCTRAGVIETTFREETETDLFGEQAVLCGGVTELVKTGFDTLVDAGYSPEMAYFECLNELKLIVDLMYEGGHMEMWNSVSDTAEYGGLTRGDDVINRDGMEKILEEIQNGEFAREWINENQANRPSYKQYRNAEQDHQVEEVGEHLRKLFAWGKDN